MLLQRGRVELGEDAYFANLGVRAPSFGIQLLTTNRVVTDWGLLAPLVSYIGRQTRTQLSWVLEGRGYFDLGSRVVLLGPGDFVVSDQTRHADEGYGGTPCTVVVADWEKDGVLGPVHRGPPRLGRASARDVAAMRALAEPGASVSPLRFEASVSPLRLEASVSPLRLEVSWGPRAIATLRGVLGTPPVFDAELLVSPPDVGPLFASLAGVRERLRDRPALFELADELGVSERHARRAFEEMDRTLGVGTNGWRDFLADTRLAFAQQLLSLDGMTLARVATLSGFGSAIALCHAFSERGELTPGSLARRIRERWDGGAELDGAADERASARLR